MKVQDIVSKFSECFKQKCDEFCASKGIFPEDEVAPSDYESVSEMLWQSLSKAGTRTMAEYVESCEVKAGSILVDGVQAQYKDAVSKEFHIGFGIAKIRRRVYQPKDGGACVAPLDHLFNVVDEFAFPDIRMAVLRASAVMTPGEIVETMEDFHVPALSETALKRIVHETGRNMEHLRRKIEIGTSLSARLPDDVLALVASMDGTTVPVRHPSGDGAKYKVEFNMAMAGSISVYGNLAAREDGSLKMDRLAASGFARMPEEKYPTFKSMFDDELEMVSNALPDDVHRMLLFDGAAHQWQHVDGDPKYDRFLKLIDFCHMKEHLVAVRDILFGIGSNSGEAWMAKWEKALLEEDGSALGLTRSISYNLRARKLSSLRRKEAKTHLTYFRNNHKRMNYAWFVRRGLPIGSGPVESCCKVLIKGRLCQSGMSWSTDGGQSILTLRSHRKYGDWRSMWSSYMKHQKETYPTWKAAA